MIIGLFIIAFVFIFCIGVILAIITAVAEHKQEKTAEINYNKALNSRHNIIKAEDIDKDID